MLVSRSKLVSVTHFFLVEIMTIGL